MQFLVSYSHDNFLRLHPAYFTFPSQNVVALHLDTWTEDVFVDFIINALFPPPSSFCPCFSSGSLSEICKLFGVVGNTFKLLRKLFIFLLFFHFRPSVPFFVETFRPTPPFPCKLLNLISYVQHHVRIT
jgi:hypothetical protein